MKNINNTRNLFFSDFWIIFEKYLKVNVCMNLKKPHVPNLNLSIIYSPVPFITVFSNVATSTIFDFPQAPVHPWDPGVLSESRRGQVERFFFQFVFLRFIGVAFSSHVPISGKVYFDSSVTRWWVRPPLTDKEAQEMLEEIVTVLKTSSLAGKIARPGSRGDNKTQQTWPSPAHRMSVTPRDLPIRVFWILIKMNIPNPPTQPDAVKPREVVWNMSVVLTRVFSPLILITLWLFRHFLPTEVVTRRNCQKPIPTGGDRRQLPGDIFISCLQFSFFRPLSYTYFRLVYRIFLIILLRVCPAPVTARPSCWRWLPLWPQIRSGPSCIAGLDGKYPWVATLWKPLNMTQRDSGQFMYLKRLI